MKAKRRGLRRLLAVIALFVAFAMTPQFDNQVFSQDKTPEYIGPEQLGVDVNTTSAKVVSIGGKSWHVIGYDGQGVASGSGEIVLFADEFLASCPYNEDNGVEDYEYTKAALTYKGSTLQTTIDKYYNDNFTAGEKQSIITRQLEAMDIPENQGEDDVWWDDNFHTVDKVPYEGVDDAALWPLSAKEAMEVDRTVRSVFSGNDAYWLRTLGCVDWDDWEYDFWYPPVMAIVKTNGAVSRQDCEREDVTDSHGVRTALKLRLDNIAFACPISDAQVGWKLTLKDEAHKKFYVTDCDNTLDPNGDLVIKYQDAVPGDNEYISYIIEGSDKRITKYERICKVTSATGTATITGLPKDASGKISLNEGDKLYVFNEQDNGDKTDFSSDLMEIGTEATGHYWGFTDFGWGYRPGPGEHYAWASYNCNRHKEHWKSIDAKLEAWDNTPKCDEIVIPKYTASVTAEEAPDGIARQRTFRDNPIDPIGHKWQFVDLTWTGNEESGYTKATGNYTCERDPSHKTQYDVSLLEEVVVPTCTTAGKTIYTAIIYDTVSPSGEGRTETKEAKHIKALGHDWGEWKTISLPSCTEAGMEERICKRDKEHKETRTLKALGHKWSPWTVTKKATTSAEGEKTRTCSVCGNKETGSIAKLKISGTLIAKATANGSKALNISWTRVQNADGYDIFLSRCDANGKKYSLQKVKTVKGNKTFKWTKGKLARKTAYKGVVKAYVIKNGKKIYVRTSPLVHAFTNGYRGDYTNPKSVTVAGKAVSLKKGKSFKIQAKVNKVKKNKRLISRNHAPTLRYMTSNSRIAVVNGSGRITARGKGSCTVYVYAANGVCNTVRVTVK